jgi:2-polyprenyl-6-methoxyphenol hydroxylase-like FAD-dependent oxidoreductase
MKSAPVTKPDLANVDVLIIGAGPAGASLACFLAQYGSYLRWSKSLTLEGLSIMMISRAKFTAKTPRAHITNVAALECLRDIDLDKKCAELASPQSAMLHTRWVESFLGEEYCRLWSWGNDPTRKVFLILIN